MKKTKIALTLVCAILIVAASVMGTLAYLTATTETVTNTFSVGNVKFAADALDEALVDEYGNPGKMEEAQGSTEKKFTKVDKVEDADRVTENDYKLVPGHEYTKDPKIHMDANSEACYLFVTVTNPIASLEDTTASTIAQQMAAKGWKEVKNNNVVVAYIYYGTTTTTNPDGSTTTTVNTAKTQVAGGTTVDVFDYFKLSTTADVNATTTKDGEEVSLYEGAQILIQAYAIQADGIPASMTDYELWQQASGSAT